MAKGDTFQNAVTPVEDGRARKPTVQLTPDSHRTCHLASTSFTAAGDRLLYSSDSTGRHELYLLNLATFASTQLTDADAIFVAGATYDDSSRSIFYWQGTSLKAVNIDTLDERVICDYDYQGGRLSVSSDGRLIAFGADCQDIPGFGEEFFGRGALILVSARGEGSHPVLTTPFRIGRVEFNPADSSMLVYSWAGAWDGVLQRNWWTDTNGLFGGPLGAQNPNETRGGAYFAPSGNTLGYHGSKYHIRRTDEGYIVEETAWFVGSVDSDGRVDRQYLCPGPTGRCRPALAEGLFVCDVGGAFVPEHESISLIRVEGEKGVFEPVFFFGPGGRASAPLPRPQFSPDDSAIVFTASSESGAAVYLATLKK